MEHKKRAWCLGVLTGCSAVTGVVLMVVAITIISIFPSILQQQVTERVPLRMGSPTFQQLQDPTPPLFKDIFFFNLTNPQEFEAGAKPLLQEVGPYSYTEKREKTILNISSDQELLTYNQSRIFSFNQNTTASGLQETDTICTINLPLVAAVNLLEEQGRLVNLVGPTLLRGIFRGADAHLYVCQEATKLAWNYTDDLVVSLHRNLALRAAGLNYPRTFVNIQVNNSVNDSFPSTIRTGVATGPAEEEEEGGGASTSSSSRLQDIGTFVRWKGNEEGRVEVWPNGMGANQVNGTEGLVFRPFLEPNETLEVFSDDAFRTIRLVHADTLSLGRIRRVFRFEIANLTFESAFTNPENVRWGSWNPDGLFFLGPTQDPVVPVFGSKPHFLDGDPVLREKVRGLAPNRSLHDSALNIDPLTGANVQFSIKVQINAQINQSTSFRQLENVNGTVYIPILYFDEHSVLTPEFSDFLLENGLGEAYLFMALVPVMFGLLLVFSVVSFLVALIAFVFCLQQLCCAKAREEKGPTVASNMVALQNQGGGDGEKGNTSEQFA